MTKGMIEVFLAKKIITMNPSWPTGTAIAVRDGEILGVGDASDFDAWRQSDEPLVIRDDFATLVQFLHTSKKLEHELRPIEIRAVGPKRAVTLRQSTAAESVLSAAEV